MARKPGYTVTTADVDVRYDDAGPALSRALTEALRAKTAVTVYVRDPKGDPIGYAERLADGTIEIRRHHACR